MSYEMNKLGVGYLPYGARKLPKREKGNLVEAFLIKREHGSRNVTLDHNQWPLQLSTFKSTVLNYTQTLERLAKSLLPLYAVALDLPPNFFDEASIDPTWRLRLSHYPPIEKYGEDEYGIAPHVDTTFFTLLAQSEVGLVVSGKDNRWVRVPFVADTFVVNTGELLKQWSNHRFVSTRHYAVNESGGDRYSMPFFFNANADYKMVCLPTCCSTDNPPRYPPMSYLESQAVAQGE